MIVDYILTAHGFGGGRRSKDDIPPPPIVGLRASHSGDRITLTWTNPDDTDFVGLKVIRNESNLPNSVTDGEEIYDGQNETCTDIVIRGQEVFYRAFPYDFDINYNMDSGQTTSIIAKAQQSAPSAPTLSSKTYDSVTLNKVGNYQYSRNGTSWQNSNVFTGLEPDTNYTFYQRKPESKFLLASPKSTGLSVKTKVPPYDDTTGSPGSAKLIGGDMQAGFFGEVPSSEFITGDALARLVGITAGTSQHSNGGWLKFAYKGKVQFVCKKPIRYNISWDNINSANAVYGNKQVTINGKKYKVRLMRGANEKTQPNPDTPSGSYNGAINHGSEWNKLMLPIHEQAKDGSWAYKDNVESGVPNWGVGYTDADLLTHSSHGNGSYSWCQELAESTRYRLNRGYNGVSNSLSGSPSRTETYIGWRACLELVGG